MEGQGLRRDLGELQSVEKRIIAYQKKAVEKRIIAYLKKGVDENLGEKKEECSAKGVDENLGEKKEECSAKVEELKTEEKQCQKFSDELDRLTSSLEQTKTTIRQLQDNLDLRKIEKSLDELK
ncbi:hypothetical protein T484DRAFT_1768062 [Baffinella frigidus]|nr:hypothetical protein T484DRAFT_1768062 [Cryptophyta sp. CCMP2293]